MPILADALSGHCCAIPCRITDETHIKVKGKWTYLYRAIDKLGQTLDFMLSERRDEAATPAFFAKVIASNGWPDKVVHPLPGRALQSNVPRGA